MPWPRFCIFDPVRLTLWITAVTGVVTFIRWLNKGYIKDIEARYIFVTGCDSGFGYRLVLRLDGMGCYVFATCLTPEGAAALMKETSERVVTMLMDVTKDEEIEKAAEYVSHNLPPDQGLWAVVNNAGTLGPIGPLETLSRAHYIHVLNINTLGMAQVTRYFLPLVRKERGRIVNTLSMSSRFPFYPGAYSMSQAACSAFNDELRQELYQHNISVHGVLAGPFLTNMLDLNNQRQLLLATYARVSPYARHIYGEDFVERMMEIIERGMKLFADYNLEDVVDALVHAIFAKSPRTHYVKGRFADYYMQPLSYLPAWISTVLVQPAYPGPKDMANNKSIVRSVSRLWETMQSTPDGTNLERRTSRLSVSSRRSFGNLSCQSPSPSPTPLTPTPQQQYRLNVGTGPSNELGPGQSL